MTGLTEAAARKAGKASQQDPFHHLGARAVCWDADAAKVVWCRVKGYPWW